MDNLNKQTSLPKMYSIAATMAFIYSCLTIVFLVYKQFFYIDGTWLHGLLANSLATVSILIWTGILFVFKRFLKKVIHYNKADKLINAYLVFLAITIFSVGTVVINAIKLYISLGSQTFDSLTA